MGHLFHCGHGRSPVGFLIIYSHFRRIFFGLTAKVLCVPVRPELRTYWLKKYGNETGITDKRRQSDRQNYPDTPRPSNGNMKELVRE